MIELNTPGIHIVEPVGGIRPIEGASTSVLAVVGFTPAARLRDKKGEREDLDTPVAVSSWTEFCRKFGARVDRKKRLVDAEGKLVGGEPAGKPEEPVDFDPFFGEDLRGSYTALAVKGYFSNGGSRAVIVRVPHPAGAEKKRAAKGGGPISEEGSPSKADLMKAIEGDAARRTGLRGLESQEDVTMVCCPDLHWAAQRGWLSQNDVTELQRVMVEVCVAMGDRLAILDPPPGLDVEAVKTWRDSTSFFTPFAALYYPWVLVSNPSRENGGPDHVALPPSGHMAGVWARTDATRGVHKAPANEEVRGVAGFELEVTAREQGVLNPMGINCLRAFSGMGLRVWGARTLETNNIQWRYINVRRLFCFVERSVVRGTSWVTFEPNTMDLWARVKRDISAFLTACWKEGMLFGKNASEAFYVKCDEELNPYEEQMKGILTIEIGLRPTMPAEFVVLRVTQKTQGES